ncbi:MAG: hypothetical protein AB1600_00815 [Bacteroidota bacterium]
MKKTFTIVFLLLYLMLNVGMTILVHTCAGESNALLVTSEVKDPCRCGDETRMEEKCCTTELKTVKLDDSQQISTPASIEKLVVVDLLAHESASVSATTTTGITFQTIPFSPPPNKDYQIFNSVFLI